jgi:phage terminase large subunit
MTQNDKPNVFAQWVERYQNNPVLFVDEVLGATPDKWQIKFLQAIAKGNRKISVRSGHGVGKSTASAWAMLWYFMTRTPVKVVVTAPTSAQLFDAMFAELKRWVMQMPQPLQDLLTVKQDRIVFNAAPDEMFISARTSRAEQPEALQGIHSENVMLVADEASGVPEQVFEAAAGSMSGHNAVTLLLGNPTRSSGFFYDTHNRLGNEWVTFRVSCEDSPRVSSDYISEMMSRYGEESNAFRIRVLGDFPRSDDDTIIPMELIEGAKQRDVQTSQSAPMLWGLDVARFGSDSSSLTKRKGNVVIEPPRVWRNLDLMQLTGAVVAEYEAQKPEDKPDQILVDSIGLGAGVVDRLRELGLPAEGVNVSESPSFSPNQTYANLKAELWYKAKAWFERRDCRIPDDSRLISELATVRYTFTSSGKTKVESKEDIKKRGLKSPDCADSLILTFAGDAATAMYGSSGGSKNWAKPLRRNVPRLA